VPVPQDTPAAATQFWWVTAQPPVVVQQPGVAHSQPSSAVGAVGFEQLEYPESHVGEHVPVALQAVADAFAVEHARPQAPQLAVVSVDPQPPELLPEPLPLLDPLLLPELLPLLLPELPDASPPLELPELLLPEDELPLLLLDPLLDVLPELLEPLDELLDAPESLPEPPLELLLLEEGAPPRHTEIVDDVAPGADAWQVCPDGQSCDGSQNAEQSPWMQMSFSPQLGLPCVSSQVSPAFPGPALRQE
jgi:hypothetical protein